MLIPSLSSLPFVHIFFFKQHAEAHELENKGSAHRAHTRERREDREVEGGQGSVLLRMIPHLLRLLQETDSQVSRAWSDFQHSVARAQRRLFHNTLHHQRVFQNVLSKVLVKDQAACTKGKPTRSKARL
jgi:hypothetical protein